MFDRKSVVLIAPEDDDIVVETLYCYRNWSICFNWIDYECFNLKYVYDRIKFITVIYIFTRM